MCKRNGISQKCGRKVLVDCGRCCTICHKFCSTKIELYHIKQVADGDSDTYVNCIPLCFDCPADVKAYDPKHPKGFKNLLFTTRYNTPINSQIYCNAIRRIVDEINLTRDLLDEFEYFFWSLSRHSFATR